MCLRSIRGSLPHRAEQMGQVEEAGAGATACEASTHGSETRARHRPERGPRNGDPSSPTPAAGRSRGTHCNPTAPMSACLSAAETQTGTERETSTATEAETETSCGSCTSSAGGATDGARHTTDMPESVGHTVGSAALCTTKVGGATPSPAPSAATVRRGTTQCGYISGARRRAGRPKTEHIVNARAPNQARA